MKYNVTIQGPNGTVHTTTLDAPDALTAAFSVGRHLGEVTALVTADDLTSPFAESAYDVVNRTVVRSVEAA